MKTVCFVRVSIHLGTASNVEMRNIVTSTLWGVQYNNIRFLQNGDSSAGYNNTLSIYIDLCNMQLNPFIHPSEGHSQKTLSFLENVNAVETKTISKHGLSLNCKNVSCLKNAWTSYHSAT